MSAAQSVPTLEDKLEALQCHFTWDLDSSRFRLLRLRDQLEDIGTELGNKWLGHIYNLQGFIHYRLGSVQEARSFFSRAAEAFRQMRNTVLDEGPWLVVNYGNKAWLHYHQGEQAESQACLSMVDQLMRDYPSPEQDELHPETCAEKAWTLMKFGEEGRVQAADYFQKAIRMQPDMVEWQSSHVLALVHKFNSSNLEVDADVLGEIENATEQDPENLLIAIQYLDQRGKKGESVEDEAQEFARRVLENPVSSYNGLKALLRVYKDRVSIDEAVNLAEEALGHHPDERYLKRCAALCYKWKIFSFQQSSPEQSLIDKATGLYKEVIDLYPHSSLGVKIDLANIYAKSMAGLATAGEIFQELLLRQDLEPEAQQMLYNNYANHLFFGLKDRYGSVKYHMKAAEIPEESFFRKNSINTLRKVKDKMNRMCREIEEFLANLQQP